LANQAVVRAQTLADRAFPRQGLWRDVLLVTGGALFTSLLAQVSVPLPFTPVPITLQTLGVLFLGAGLGARRGALSQLVYVAAGWAGLPVYAGGTGGAAHLFGPTGGYLLGFVVAAYLAGWLAERGYDRAARRSVLAMVLADLCIYAFGLPWLGFYVGFGKVLLLGFVPFVVGDALKILLASGLLPALWRIAGSEGR
jgi:biotin transport system substrate-specific component